MVGGVFEVVVIFDVLVQVGEFCLFLFRLCDDLGVLVVLEFLLLRV